jgi:YlmC/YmxH family sporulation protein
LYGDDQGAYAFLILNKDFPRYTYRKEVERGVFQMRLSELSGKEIVDVKKAERLGILGQTDLEINENTGQIQALLIPSLKWFGFRKQGEEIRVPWNHIKKIGSEMIIIDVPEEE